MTSQSLAAETPESTKRARDELEAPETKDLDMRDSIVHVGASEIPMATERHPPL